MTGINTASSRQREEADVDAMILANAGNTDGAAQPPATEQQQSQASTESGTPTDAPQQQAAPESNDPPATSDASISPKATEVDEEATFKARYQALRGKYDKEVPALHTEIRSLKEQLNGSPVNSSEVATLRQQLANLQEQLATAQAQPPQQQSTQTPANAAGLDDLRREYGDELVDGIVGHVQASLAPLSEQLNNVSQESQQSRGESFKASLTAILAPQGIDFEDYNNAPDFLEWLRSPSSNEDPTPRQELLNRAVNNGNLRASAEFFTRYKASLGASRDSNLNPLEQHQEIGNTGGPTPDNLPPEDGLTPLQRWELGTDEFLKGKITAEELDRLEKEMFAAQ